MTVPISSTNSSRPTSSRSMLRSLPCSATKRPSGREKVLSPRELRALLAAGRTYGYQRDSAWWNQRAEWAYARILSVDPEDIEANAGMGHTQVGDQRHLKPATGRDAVDCRNDGLFCQQYLFVHVAYGAEPVLDIAHLRVARLAQIDAGLAAAHK